METIDYVDEQHLRVGGDTFAFGYPLRPEDLTSTPPVLKTRELIDQLAELLHRVAPQRIVELGIYRGGSAALIAALAQPKTMVAIDLARHPAPALETYLEERQLTDSVLTRYGVDQADTNTLSEILDGAFGEEPIDFAIDDASHRYEPTRRSFELIFPRLRPGGIYVIEDWSAEHKLPARLVDSIDRRVADWEPMWNRVCEDLRAEGAESLPDDKIPDRSELVAMSQRRAARDSVTPLSRLGLELLLASAEAKDVIRRIEITWGWFLVERGAGEIPDGNWLDKTSMDLFASLRR